MGLRQDRIADQIRDVIASVFSRDEISDPRLSGVSITAVHVTADLQIAKVYYRLLDKNDETIAAAKQGFQSCKGFLRKKLSGVLDLRRAPELRFFFDKSVEEGARIEGLLSDVKDEEDT